MGARVELRGLWGKCERGIMHNKGARFSIVSFQLRIPNITTGLG